MGDLDCNKIRSDIESVGPVLENDIPALNYLYSSLFSPFGYAHISLEDTRGNTVQNPLEVPICFSDIVIRTPPSIALTCVGGEEIYDITDARPYLNFSYRMRKTCDNNAACNPDAASIACPLQCYTICKEDTDCPSEHFCFNNDSSAKRGDVDLADLSFAERNDCVNLLDDPTGYCILEEDTDTDTDTTTSTLPLNTAAEDGLLCKSECERDGRGRAIGICSNTGDFCTVQDDCFAIRCEGGYCSGNTSEAWPVGPGDASFGEDEGGQNSLGKTRIAELFAKSFGAYKWSTKIMVGLPIIESPEESVELGNSRIVDDDFGDYVEMSTGIAELSSNDFSPWNITETGDPITGEVPKPPHVAPLKLPCINDKCFPLTDGGAENYVSGITVNDKNSGTLISRSGELSASIKFFAWADKNQMPIKRVCVDFKGDGSDTSSDCTGGNPVNFYKNHWGYKNDGSKGCDASDFGHAPQACTEDFFS